MADTSSAGVAPSALSPYADRERRVVASTLGAPFSAHEARTVEATRGLNAKAARDVMGFEIRQVYVTRNDGMTLFKWEYQPHPDAAPSLWVEVAGYGREIGQAFKLVDALTDPITGAEFALKVQSDGVCYAQFSHEANAISTPNIPATTKPLAIARAALCFMAMALEFNRKLDS